MNAKRVNELTAGTKPFGQWLKEQRSALGVTQVEMCRRIKALTGVTFPQPTLSRNECSDGWPNAVFFGLYCRVLGIPTDQALKDILPWYRDDSSGQ